MSSGYQVTIKIANSGVTSGMNELFVPHAFVTITGPGLSNPVTIGYYPQVTGVSGPGTVKNDLYTHEVKDAITKESIYEPHPYDRSITFDVSAQQAMNGLQFAAKVANDPGTYQLLGAADKSNIVMADGYQCTGFARDVVRAMGIEGLDLYPTSGFGSALPTLLSKYPGMLGPEFSFLAANQYQPYRGTPTVDEFATVSQRIYSGIKKFDSNDHTPPSAVPSVNGSNTLDSNITAPGGLGSTRNSASFITDTNANDHLAVIKTGGTLGDLWVLQKSSPNGFANDKEFYAAVLASNPNIADVNKIAAGTSIYLPEKFADGSITYNYVGGTAINSNAATGEYHMVVQNEGGGQTVYSRKVDADAGYAIKQTTTNATGQTTYEFTGHQATLDSNIKPLTTLQKTDTNADGQLDKTVVTQQIGADLIEIKTDTNADNRWESDVLRIGDASYNLLDMNQRSNAEALLSLFHKQNLMSDVAWNDFTSYSTSLLTGGLGLQSGGGLGLQPPSWLDPIGAFYDSQSKTYDSAPSIASKTTRAMSASGQALSVSQLATLDTNQDGKLSTAETSDVRMWADLNENGRLDSGELQGLTVNIQSSDYGFYTQGNGQAAASVVLIPSVPGVNTPGQRPQALSANASPTAVGLPTARGFTLSGLPTAPAYGGTPDSNYRTLRDTDNVYVQTNVGVIGFNANQIKINNYNRSYLIGTDGMDSFDASYYAAYTQYFNNSLLVNFLAGGGDDQMGGSARNDNLWGGTGNDTLYGYAGDDKVYGEEDDDVLLGQDGNDSLDGGSGNDALVGGNGDDVAWGGDGADELQGNDGADQLMGQSGNDRLFGQVGNDSLWGGEGDDLLQGFTAGNDAQQSLYAGQTDNDVLMGEGGNDTLVGGVGQDLLDGGVGNDVLDGGAGDDTLQGQAGSDTLYGGDGADRLDGGADNDVLLGNAGDDMVWGGDGADELQGGDGADQLMGQSGDDQMFAGVGDDFLDGGSGDDLLDGGDGNDTLLGGVGNDQLQGQAGQDLIDGGDGNDVVLAGQGHDTVWGGAGADELQGNEGNDYLMGEADNDRLFGQSGNDTLLGGNGDDILVGFTASNETKQTLSAGETDDDVLFGEGGNDGLYGGLGNDTLDGGVGNDALLGGAGNDVLLGGDGGDELQGGDGNDQLSGGAGDDRLFGQLGNDTLWGGDGNDVLAGFTATNETKQSLAAGETDDDVLYGGAGTDVLLGGVGNDMLSGGTERDELQGGSGDDALYGDEGNDNLFGQVGNDTLYGGDGDDYLQGFTASNETQQSLNAGESDNDYLYGGAGSDTLVGGVGNDYLDGGAGVDVMVGGEGDDIYIVNSVNDSIYEQANAGYDTVVTSTNYLLNSNVEELRLLEGFNINGTGNARDNKIIGNSADNILDGVTGADTMIGGLGSDTYYVDNVGDVVTENANEGTDTVQASISYTLGANAENLVLLDFSKPEKGLVDGQNVLVFGYPKRNELDYMQGDAVANYAGTCALTSIANLLTQQGTPTTEGEVVNLAITNNWAVNNPNLPAARLGGSNVIGQRAILDSYSIRNDVITGNNEVGVANLLRSGRGVICALNAGKLWGDSAYVGDGGANHAVTLTGAVYKESDFSLIGFYLADSGRGRVSDMTRFVDISTFRDAVNVSNAYAIYTIEPVKFWQENINGTGNIQANTLVGNRGDNVLSGLDGDDAIQADAGNDTLVGGVGNDLLNGGSGDDVYRFALGDGHDVIDDSDGVDVLVFGAGVQASNVTVARDGASLLLTLNAKDSVRINNTTGNNAIDQVRFSDGTIWYAKADGSGFNASLTGSVVIQGQAIQGQALTLSSTLVDSDGLGALSYQWQCSSDGVTWNNVSGYTNATFALGQAQVGKMLRAQVSYIDGRGNIESVTTFASALVVNVNDAPTGAVLVTGATTQGQTLKASHTLVDVDGLGTVSYQWLADGVNIAGATDASFELTQAQVGKTISVASNYTDAFGTLERVVSATTGKVVSFAPSAPSANDDFLVGSAGADIMLGLAGNDVLEGGAGGDTLDGGVGVNTASYASSVTGVDVDLTRGVLQDLTAWLRTNKPGQLRANQSSTWISWDRSDNPAGRAIDGFIGNQMAMNITLNGANEWLQIDLGSSYELSRVELYNRGDWEGNRLNGAVVELLDESGHVVKNLGTVSGAGAATVHGFDSLQTARYVRVSESYQYLHLAEVKVFGKISNDARQLGGDAQGDVVLNIQNLVGSAQADILKGDAANNVLEGGAGADTLDGGEGMNTASYASSVTGVDVDLTRGAVQDLTAWLRTNKPGQMRANQSSTWFSWDLSDNPASRAIDGFIGNQMAMNMTLNGANEWLQIDLGASYELSRVELYNRGDWEGYRLNGAVVELLDESGRVVKNLGTVSGAGDATIHGFDSQQTARYVRVSESYQYLHLAEVKVFGKSSNDAQQLGGDAQGDVLLNIQNLVGSAQADILKGDAANNVLEGGAGNDTLVGQAGNDTYVFGRGTGEDIVIDTDSTEGNIDVISVGAGVANDQLWFKHVSNDLEISIIGSADKATIQNWYSGSQNHVEQIKVSNKTLLNTDVEKLVQAMASFSAPASGQATLPTNYQTTLAPVIAANWH